ncbi:DUF551 domain-containing protein, partial [Escherichia coli]|nr:DUF551 domain-containing protein [Escherichia coli]
PPAPVAVPECFKRLLHHAYGMTMGHDWNKGTMAGHHRAKLCQAVDECRAAMLQGAEPVSNRDELPDGWVACSDRMPENKPGSYEYLVFESLNNGVHHDYWNVPDVGDNCQFTPFWNHYDRYVTHWMPLPAAPQQEA